MLKPEAGTNSFDPGPLLHALTSLQKGDFSARLPENSTGITREIAKAFNGVVQLNKDLADELDRVGSAAKTDRKVARSKKLPRVKGSWAKAFSSVDTIVDIISRPRPGQSRNGKASVSLIDRELLKTVVALKRGDFSVRLPDDWIGVPGKIADTLNDVISRNDSLTRELERVSRVVGKEGKIAQRAALPMADGSWNNLVDAVNTLIDDMARPTTEMARVIGAVANGDLSQTMALDVDGRPLKGEFLRSVKLVNAMVGQLGSFASEVTRVAREVGTEGKLGGEAKVKGVAGTWKDLTDSVNSMAGNLTPQVRNIAEVTTAVARGDLSKKITVDVRGEILELKNTINTMVDQLNAFASEVTRVAREVGTEGKLGGQAQVPDVAGTWKDLTDNVNSMAGNLTGQVRNIAEVTTAVANGDLSKKITVDVKGEILELKNTINRMVDQLNSFASEVTRVAREVGTEGKLGGQAQVRGVAGTWKDLTDNVTARVEAEKAQQLSADLLMREEQARADAEAANRLKDEFLATVSHELRTPLNSILGWSQLMRTGDLDEESATRALQTIERNTRALAQIIDDLLDVSRIITGKLRLRVRPIELGPVVEAALEAVRPATDAKNIRLEVLLDPQTGIVSGDASRLQQIVWNLLSNAIKFTPSAGHVEVRLGRAGENAQITIIDNGEGINQEFLPHVFDRFRQADSTFTRTHGGLGLGLAIVRHLVELHGGAVSADSEGRGKGATFAVSFPLLTRAGLRGTNIEQRSEAGRLYSTPSADLSGLRVMIVDDELDAREVITAMLEHCGAEVIAACSTAEAVDVLAGAANGSRPDVLVSDIGMPGEDGIDLITRVRALGPERGGNIPAIALTAYARAEDRARVLAAGYQRHIAKPVEPAMLAAVVAVLARRTAVAS